MRTPEEILDYHMHQMGKHTVGLHESDLYECAINAIKEALTIPVVVGQSEQLKAFCLHGGIQMLVPTKAKDLDELIKDYVESL